MSLHNLGVCTAISKLTVNIDRVTEGAKSSYDGTPTQTRTQLHSFSIDASEFQPMSGSEVKFTDKETVFADHKVYLPYTSNIIEKDVCTIDGIDYDIIFVRQYIGCHTRLDLQRIK